MHVVLSFLKSLEVNSAAGPDGMAAIVLKKLAAVIAIPLLKLLRKIINTGIWPETWKAHHIFPLFNRGTSSNSENYRGIHLTPQISKVVERILAHLFITPLVRSVCIFGPNQFAYTRNRGSRDMIAFLMLSWLMAFMKREKIAFYRSDVTAAFDRVDAELLLQKLNHGGIHPRMHRVLESWLGTRKANVIVGGEMSIDIIMKDMIFQGTVFGIYFSVMLGVFFRQMASSM